MSRTLSQSMSRPSIHQAADIKKLLLQYKALTPLSKDEVDELQRLSMLDVSSYSEADVRAEIIDQVVRILGYKKETYFSLVREKHLKLLDADMFIDYNMTLWSEAFWVIEAKRVKRDELRFNAAELQQALRYAAHPDINAALLVLCDGRVFEVYDREESLVNPVARVEVKNLADEFHVLQALLSPWQSWFFQKRRVLRLMDKVLGHEINLGRLREFREELDISLDQKRAKVIDNWREVTSRRDDRAQRLQIIQAHGIEDLVDGEMFVGQSKADKDAIARALVDKGGPDGFRVLSRIFPDRPRDMNDNFVALALWTLIEFETRGVRVMWLPSWLAGSSQPADVEGAIKRLIALSVSTFDAEPQRKMILQYSACVRRVAKICMALVPMMSQIGRVRHQQLRHTLDELAGAQFMSSPEGQGLRALDQIQILATMQFLRVCNDDRGNFNVARAQTTLRDAWANERLLLQDGQDYWVSLEGRGYGGEILPTERSWVDHDSLGLHVICMLERSKKWKSYVKTNHYNEFARIAATDSLLADQMATPPASLTDEEQALRFFGGNTTLFQDLSRAYSARPRK
ncbi:type I restriction endonuclease subunit R [Burkholderia cepacia]|uniref:type I restriction endonuclease subunit R n=1 Tax=Burkholderia cepacia TaxID=292 RepID=UPI0012D96B55|nr:type I restriction endonuclease subunit R [Burkholderia cepacia]